MEEAIRIVTQRYYFEFVFIAAAPVGLAIVLIMTIAKMLHEAKCPEVVPGDKTLIGIMAKIFRGAIPAYIVGIIILSALISLSAWASIQYVKDLNYITNKEFCSFIGIVDETVDSSDGNWPTVAFIDSSTGEIREINIREIKMEKGDKYIIIYLPNTLKGYCVEKIE